jgi:hypothetical protein
VNDAKMKADAMYWYAQMRWQHATAIGQKTYRMKDGKPPTAEDVKRALDAAEQADRLVGELREEANQCPS